MAEDETELDSVRDAAISDEQTGDRVARRDAKRREALKKRAEEAQARATELEDELDSYRNKAGELDKTMQRKEALIEKLKAELDEVRGVLDGERSKARTDKLLDRLATSTGIENRVLLRGVLSQAKEMDPELDIAPESIDDRLVRDVTKTIGSLAPELFKPKEGGERRKPPAAPGANTLGLPKDERPSNDDWLTERVKNMPRVGGRRDDW